MKTKRTKRKEKIEPELICELASWMHLLLAELSPGSRRKLLELPSRDLRKLANAVRRAA